MKFYWLEIEVSACYYECCVQEWDFFSNGIGIWIIKESFWTILLFADGQVLPE